MHKCAVPPQVHNPPPPITFLFHTRGEGGYRARPRKASQAIFLRWHVKGGGFGPYLKCICEGGPHHSLSRSGWTLLRVDGSPAIDKPSQMVYNMYRGVKHSKKERQTALHLSAQNPCDTIARNVIVYGLIRENYIINKICQHFSQNVTLTRPISEPAPWPVF